MESKIASIAHHYRIYISALVALALLGIIFASSTQVHAASESREATGRIITLHDNGADIGFMTKKTTLREALKEQKIRLDTLDRTEPGLDEKLVATSYQVNVYRARPVAVRDGNKEARIITSYRTAKQIANQAKITLYDEDTAKVAPSRDPIADGAAEVMTIARSTPFTFTFYGKEQTSRTMARTVGDMLKEKGIKMEAADGISVPLSTQITAGMSLQLWRNGVQTITQEEDVKFEIKQTEDADQPKDYKKVTTPGENGKRTVTYEINMQNGVEVSRKEINSVTTKRPIQQVEIVGTKRPAVAGPAEIIAKINSVSSAKGIDGNRVAAIAKCESGFNPNADSGYYKGLFQHDPRYWDSRAAKYGFSGASIYDVDAQIGVSTSMMAAGGWSHWGCKG